MTIIGKIPRKYGIPEPKTSQNSFDQNAND